MTTIRQEARRPAVSIIELTERLVLNREALADYVEELAPGPQNIRGVGPVIGAQVIAAYSHNGLIRSEAAFANRVGAASLQASSGNTTRHWLNRQGDRRPNRALDTIIRVRLTCDRGPGSTCNNEPRTHALPLFTLQRQSSSGPVLSHVVTVRQGCHDPRSDALLMAACAAPASSCSAARRRWRCG